MFSINFQHMSCANDTAHDCQSSQTLTELNSFDAVASLLDCVWALLEDTTS